MITPMKRILLAGRLGERAEVLAALQTAGVVHVEPVDSDKRPATDEIVRDIQKAFRTLEILDPIILKDSTPLAIPGTPARLVEQAMELATQLGELESLVGKLREELNRVAPWGRINPEELELLRKKNLDIKLLICPESLRESIESDVLQTIADHDGQLFLMAVSRNPIIVGTGVAEIKIPDRDAVAVETALKKADLEVKHCNERLAELARRREDIRGYYLELVERKQFLEVENGLLNEGPVFILKGWIPATNVEGLSEHFETSKLPVAAQFFDPADEEAPPTKLENAWWCAPIEWMFKFLGITPGYREADISPFFFPFLTIFTAMLMADAGYGLTSLIGLLVFYKTLQKNGVETKLLNMMCTLLAGVCVYGIFINSWFGTSPKMLNLTGFNPSTMAGEEALKWFCFFLGSIHLSIAHAWKIRRSPLGLVSLSEIGWIIFIWAMRDLVNLLVIGGQVYGTLPARTLPMFYVSLFLVFFFTAPSINVLSMALAGIQAIALNAAAFLSDIISYIRLWAVGLAGGILGASFNGIAAELPFVFMVVVLIGAHLMNFSLCLVAILAHGVRLNLLEFSNHLGMEWSGREYNPFRRQVK